MSASGSLVAGSGSDRSGPGAAPACVECYYTARLRRHGATPQGVDWDSEMSQRLRFVQLLKVVRDWSQPLSLHDLGCGYGALLAHLADRHPGAIVHYMGTDVSAEMIARARRRRHPRGAPRPRRFAVATATLPVSDYSVASGIFNVKLETPAAAWEQHVASTLSRMRSASRKGFAVNFMSPQALALRPGAAANLYGAPATQWTAYCRDVLACEVELVADYGLPEFTLLVRHPS